MRLRASDVGAGRSGRPRLEAARAAPARGPEGRSVSAQRQVAARLRADTARLDTRVAIADSESSSKHALLRLTKRHSLRVNRVQVLRGSDVGYVVRAAQF
eukprot:1438196-Rhodomonas_salina.2